MTTARPICEFATGTRVKKHASDDPRTGTVCREGFMVGIKWDDDSRGNFIVQFPPEFLFESLEADPIAAMRLMKATPAMRDILWEVVHHMYDKQDMDRVRESARKLLKDLEGSDVIR